MSRQTNRQADRYLNAVAALAQAGNQIKLNLAGKLGLGEAKVGFLKRYLILVTQTHRHTDTYLNAVVALAPAGNQIKLDWAGKLGLGQAN